MSRCLFVSLPCFSSPVDYITIRISELLDEDRATESKWRQKGATTASLSVHKTRRNNCGGILPYMGHRAWDKRALLRPRKLLLGIMYSVLRAMPPTSFTRATSPRHRTWPAKAWLSDTSCHPPPMPFLDNHVHHTYGQANSGGRWREVFELRVLDMLLWISKF